MPAIDKDLFLRQIEEAVELPPGSVSETDRFDRLEGWDSMAALSIIALVDLQYGMTLDARELMSCQTVGDLARLVEKGR